MLTLSFSQLLQQLRTADRVLLAVALLIGLTLLYAGDQGLSWLSARSTAGDLYAQARQIQTALGNSRVGGSTGTQTLNSYVERLANESQDLTFATNDDLMAVLNDTARSSRVVLSSTSLKDAQTKTVGPMTYDVVNAAIRVEGQLSRIYGYIDALSQNAPTVNVLSTRLGGFGLAPWAELSLEFLVRPQPAAGASK